MDIFVQMYISYFRDKAAINVPAVKTNDICEWWSWLTHKPPRIAPHLFISSFTPDVIAVRPVALQRGHVPKNTILHPENRHSLGILTQNGKLLAILSIFFCASGRYSRRSFPLVGFRFSARCSTGARVRASRRPRFHPLTGCNPARDLSSVSQPPLTIVFNSGGSSRSSSC